MHRLSVLLWILGGAACMGCGGTSFPGPPTMAHPHGAYQPVPYPPPAALVEVVPPPPSRDALWVDGHWVWRFGRFVWERGGWIRLGPRDVRLSPWNDVYRSDGTLLFAPNIWRGPHGRPVEPPELTAPANLPPVPLVGEHSTPP